MSMILTGELRWFCCGLLLVLALPQCFTAEPDATCSSVSVKPGGKAELLFQMKKVVDLSNKYYIYVRKDTEPDHIVECDKVEGAEGQCTTQGDTSNLAVTLSHRNLTLTFGKTSRKDEGRYTMDMFVNNAQLNSTSCNLTIEDVGSASAGPSARPSAWAIAAFALFISAFVGF